MLGHNDCHQFNNLTATASILSIATAIGIDIGVQDNKFGLQKWSQDNCQSMRGGWCKKSSQTIQNV